MKKVISRQPTKQIFFDAMAKTYASSGMSDPAGYEVMYIDPDNIKDVFHQIKRWMTWLHQWGTEFSVRGPVETEEPLFEMQGALVYHSDGVACVMVTSDIPGCYAKARIEAEHIDLIKIYLDHRYDEQLRVTFFMCVEQYKGDD